MKLRFLVALLCASLGAGVACAFEHGVDDDVIIPGTSTARLPKLELTSQLLQQFLVAELAGQRGQMGLAISIYRELAATTRDPRIAKRATEIAVYGRQLDVALDNARLWVATDPDSAAARQMLTSLLAAGGRSEELSAQVAKMLATEGPNIGPALLRLNRVFARSLDKPAVRKLIDDVTAPYLDVAEAHFARAVAAFEAQDAAAARVEAERALAMKPDWEQAALLSAQLSPHAEMLDRLQRFVAAHPQAREARIAYARTLVGEKRFDEARREFVAVLADNPDNADVIYAVAVLSLQLNDPALAEEHLKHLVDIGYSEADSARLYLGQIAEERKNWDAAITWYAQIAVGDQYLAAQARMAGALAQSGRIEEGRRVVRDAQTSSPRDRAQMIVVEAQLLRDAGRYTDAFDVLDAGLATLPGQPELLYEAGLAAEKIGRPAVLETYLRQLIQIKPDHAHAYNALGYSLADRGERLDEAQQLIDKALQMSPDDPYILDSKGWLLYRKGNNGAALEVLKKALALQPDPEIAAHCGEVLWVLGRRDEALKTWTEAVKASPGNEALAATIKRFKP